MPLWEILGSITDKNREIFSPRVLSVYCLALSRSWSISSIQPGLDTEMGTKRHNLVPFALVGQPTVLTTKRELLANDLGLIRQDMDLRFAIPVTCRVGA
jgi:hypothetical protein